MGGKERCRSGEQTCSASSFLIPHKRLRSRPSRWSSSGGWEEASFPKNQRDHRVTSSWVSPGFQEGGEEEVGSGR